MRSPLVNNKTLCHGDSSGEPVQSEQELSENWLSHEPFRERNNLQGLYELEEAMVGGCLVHVKPFFQLKRESIIPVKLFSPACSRVLAACYSLAPAGDLETTVSNIDVVFHHLETKRTPVSWSILKRMEEAGAYPGTHLSYFITAWKKAREQYQIELLLGEVSVALNNGLLTPDTIRGLWEGAL